MKKPKAPAFQLYVPDWLGSRRVKRMSLEERGGYITLLCESWDQVGLPDDETEIAEMLGLKVSSARFRRLWDALRPAFYLEGGRWFNARLERERLKHELWRAKSSEGGRRSAARRKGGSTTPPPAGSTLHSPSPSPAPKPPLAGAESTGVGGEPVAIADVVPKAVPPEASEAWRAVLRGEKPAPRREDVS